MPQKYSSENDRMQNVPRSLGQALLSWQTEEHEPLELGPRAQTTVVVLLVAIIGYSIYTNSPLMAITFILIGMVGYLLLHRPPRVLQFLITEKGVVAGDKLYEFEDIESFFIYDEPPFENILSLQTSGVLVPYVHIPIGDADPDILRDTLDGFIPEEKHHPRMVDMLEKMLHL